MLTRREVRTIAEKLGAEVQHRKRHSVATVRIEGTYIGRIGIQRGTQAGHYHVPRQLLLPMSQTLDLARCNLSKEGYTRIPRGKGKLVGKERVH